MGERMARMVQCVKLGRELPGLDKPPFPGPLGQRIYEHVSRQGWALWPAQETILINHYGLSLVDHERRSFCLIRWRSSSSAKMRRCPRDGLQTHRAAQVVSDGKNDPLPPDPCPLRWRFFA